MAHTAFDPIWKEKHCSRTKAYCWLREVMGLTKNEAHMLQMSEEQCTRVPVLVKEKGPGSEFWENWIRRGSQES